MIDRIILPTSVEANTPVTLQVIARDPDKDKLTIIWEASAGVVDKAVWTAPNSATQVVISVHVSDQNSPTVTMTKTVNVIASTKPHEPQDEPFVGEPNPPQEPPVIQEPDPPAPVEGPRWIITNQGLTYDSGDGVVDTVQLGDRFDALLADAKFKFHGKGGDGLAIFDHPNIGPFGARFDNNVLFMINTLNGKYKTAEGIGVGSSEAEMLRAYKDVPVVWVNADDGTRHAIYKSLNYAFGVEFKGGKIDIVTIINVD